MTENSHLPALNSVASPTRMEARSDAAGGNYDEDQPRKGPGLKRYLAALYRHKWLIVAVTVAGGAVGAIASRQTTLKYVAESTFWFDNAGGGGLPGPIQSSGLLPTNAWIELLRSFTVLDYVVREERLYLVNHPKDSEALAGFQIDSLFRPGDYAFRASADGGSAELRTREGILVETVRRGDPAGREIGFQWTPPAEAYTPKRTVRFTVLTPREAAKQMSASLSTRLPSGNFLGIGYIGDDPEKVASVVNTVGARFIDVAAELKRGKMTELRDILEAQLEFARRNLVAAELALENFRVQTITLPTDAAAPVSAAGLQSTTGPALAAYYDMKIRRDNLTLDADAIRRAMRSGGRDTISVDALSAVGAVQSSPELSAALTNLVSKRADMRVLLQQYTAEHPLVVRAREELEELERRVIPRQAIALVDELNARGAVLDGLIDATSVELREIPPRTIEEARLRRSVAIAEALHNDLHGRFETTKLAAESTVPDLRVLDRATAPTRPATDPRIQLILMGIAIGFGAAVGVSILLDRADPRLRYAEQVTHDLGLPIVGAVPSLRSARNGLLPSADNVKMTEALRAVRLSLTHAYGAAQPMIVTITSPGSGDGKTFITANLALTFADLGLRTLVIDGDTRRGQLHRLYGVERRPGLTDYLTGGSTTDDVIRSTQYPLVDTLPLGSRRQNAPELLSSPRMGELLASIRPRYQVILIDSPPLGAGVDPLVLATLAGNLVMVMRTGRTDRALAEAKLQMLDRLPVRVLGVVLNGFDTGDAYQYYSYLPGYEAVDEDAGQATDLLQPV